MTARWGRPTLGLEEELHVVDARSLELVSKGPEVLAALQGEAAPAARDGHVVQELTHSQVETVTAPSGGLGSVLVRAARLRAAAAAAAESAGCLLVPSGTPVAGSVGAQQVASDARYEPITTRGRSLVPEQLIAGMHVHVGLADDVAAVAADDDARVTVVDGLRAWLPPLLALTANSPFWMGQDTGFASYRQIHWQRWPVVGAPPRTGSSAAYERAVGQLVDTGVVADSTYVYWDVRLARSHPTVEVRVADVVPTLGEAATFVALARGLAVRALLDREAGREPLDTPPHALRAAMWRAARWGLEEALVDPRTGLLADAADVLRATVEHARPGLELTGDLLVAQAGVRQVLAEGNGAQRQRRAFAEGGLEAVVRSLALSATPERPTLPGPRTPVAHGDGNGWVACTCGNKHWGVHGAAGLLALRPGPRGPEVLLQLRAAWTHQGGSWGVPGGARDSHETLTEAAVREAYEETALDPAALDPVEELAVVDHGDWTFGYAVVHADEGATAHAANLESDAVVWVPLDEVAGLPLLPAFGDAWPALRTRLRALVR